MATLGIQVSHGFRRSPKCSHSAMQHEVRELLTCLRMQGATQTLERYALDARASTSLSGNFPASSSLGSLAPEQQVTLRDIDKGSEIGQIWETRVGQPAGQPKDAISPHEMGRSG